MTKKGDKRIRNTKWFSLDSMMGKVLCILLVIILTVGAFLAPKLINNLYDRGTLMQITYVDMELSPYAVNYVTVEDKLQAIARVKTAGGSLSVIPVREETSDLISDGELADIVNKEIDELGGGIDLFFSEGWWKTLTAESLVSRTKYTLYGRPDGSEDDVSQEMAPFQFWVLQFAWIGEKDETAVQYVYEETDGAAAQVLFEEGKTKNKYAPVYEYGTDRLIVCLDADFHKIYAVSFAGSEEIIEKLYGWRLPEFFGVAGTDLHSMSPANRQELQIDITQQLLAYWAEYWDTAIDGSYYLNMPDELMGAVLYRNPEAAVGESSAEEADAVMSASNTATNAEKFVDVIYIGEMSGEERVEVMHAIVEFGETDGNVVYNYQTNEVMLSSVEDVENMTLKKKEDMLLYVGAQGQEVWGEADYPTWIQKTGCRDFFEMMQF